MAGARKEAGKKAASRKAAVADAGEQTPGATRSRKQAGSGKASTQKAPAPTVGDTTAKEPALAAPQKRTRRSSRRETSRFRGDRTQVDPSKIVRVPAAHALPGENEPLRFQSGRGPITEAEALGVLRRRTRATMKDRLGVVDEASVPSDLPPWSAVKELSGIRYPPALRALAEAVAEVEDVTFVSFMELLLWERVQQPPRDPDEVDRAIRNMRRQTVGAELLDRKFGPG